MSPKIHHTLMRLPSYLFAFLLVVGSCTSCSTHGERVLTSATGTIYDCLVVMPSTALTQEQLRGLNQSMIYNNGSAYDEPVANLYDLVRVTMEAVIPGMPQAETYFSLTQIPPSAFDDMLKPTRNILYVDINSDRYTQVSNHLLCNHWSTPQAVCVISAPSSDDFIDYWTTSGSMIRDWFVRQEMERQCSFYRGYVNADARQTVLSVFGCDVLVPEEYRLILDTLLPAEQGGCDQSVRLVWCCNNLGSLRRDLMLYSYDYVDSTTFTLSYLTRRRDEVVGRVVQGEQEGTYMETEYDVIPPQMRVISMADNRYISEIRGLWRMHGCPMGGPYVSHTTLDELNQRVVTAEVFVYAPGQKKRNPLRQAEAVLYSVRLPSEVNLLREVQASR